MAQQTINGVRNFYGQRHRHEGNVGHVDTAGVEKQLVITFAGDSYSSVSFKLPKGAFVSGPVAIEIEEAFSLGGTSPTIQIGVSGSTATNYIATITKAQAEAVGTYTATSAGSLAANAVLPADTTVVIALGGTSPTITAAGKANVVVPYVVI